MKRRRPIVNITLDLLLGQENDLKGSRFSPPPLQKHYRRKEGYEKPRPDNYFFMTNRCFKGKYFLALYVGLYVDPYQFKHTVKV